MKNASNSLGMNYSTFKSQVRSAGIIYPNLDILRDNYCLHNFGLNFCDYVNARKKERRSNNYIAKELGIQKCTLYILAKRFNLDIKGKSYVLDEVARSNIVAATQKRLLKTSTKKSVSKSRKRNITLFTYEGETRTVSGWSQKLGINRSTLKWRLMTAQWPVAEALTVEVEGASLKPTRRNTSKKCGSRYELLKQITCEFKKNSQTQISTWFMIKLVSTKDVLSEENEELRANNNLYINLSGSYVSIEKALVVNDRALAAAFIACLPCFNKKKWSKAMLEIESFSAQPGAMLDYDNSTSTFDKLSQLMEKNKIPGWANG